MKRSLRLALSILLVLGLILSLAGCKENNSSSSEETEEAGSSTEASAEETKETPTEPAPTETPEPESTEESKEPETEAPPRDPISNQDLTVALGDVFKFAELPGEVNGDNGLTFYWTADGRTLTAYTDFDPYQERWYDNSDDQLNFFDAQEIVSANYGLGQSSPIRYPVLGYQLPETGRVELISWFALQTDNDYQVNIAYGTPENVIFSYDVTGDSQTTKERTFLINTVKGDMLYILFKPLELADGNWFGYKEQLTYVALGEQTDEPVQPEEPEDPTPTDPVTPVPTPGGETFGAELNQDIPFVNLVGENNGSNGLYFYWTENGSSLTAYTDYDPSQGRWYDNSNNQLNFFDPVEQKGANYGLGMTSSTRYIVQGLRLPHTGTMSLYNWFALQSGEDYRISIALGDPANVQFSFDVTGPSQTVVDNVCELHVTEGQMLYIIYKPLEVRDNAWFGYKHQLTYTAFGSQPNPPVNPPEPPEEPKTIEDINDGVTKILCIGNSFTVDTLEYAERILQSMNVTNVKLGKLVIGGASLSDHAANAASSAASYEFAVSTADGGWLTQYSQTMKSALESDNWDTVILQQYSAWDGAADTYDAGAADLIAYVRQYIHENAGIGFNATWAFQNDCTTNPAFANFGSDQMTMYNSIIAGVTAKVKDNTAYTVLVPTCTAVQNARTSYVGDTLTRDGYHMSLDRGRYVVALTFIKTVLGLDIDSVTYTPAGVSEGFRAVAIEAADNAAAKPLEVTASLLTEDPADDPQTSTKYFASITNAANGTNGLTFCYTANGALVPFTERNAGADQWYHGSAGLLVYPHVDVANNYGVAGTSAQEAIVMQYEIPCDGSIDIFLLTVLQGSNADHSYTVKLAQGELTNVVGQYTLTAKPGVSQEETYTLDVTGGQMIYIIYESQVQADGEWFGYKNWIRYRTAEETGDQPAAQIGDNFKIASLATDTNGENGVTFWHFADGSLTPYTLYDAGAATWYETPDGSLVSAFQPGCVVADNYGFGKTYTGKKIALSWQAPEAGTVSMYNWYVLQSDADLKFEVAVGTADNVVKTYDLVGDSQLIVDGSQDIDVEKDQRIYVIVTPLEDGSYIPFGYKVEFTYTAIGREPAAQVGDTFKFAELAGAQNPQNGLTLYDLADGTLTPFANYDPAVNGGRWWNNANEQLTFFDPTCDVANNYALGQASAGRDIVIGWKAVETGTVDVFAWHAIQGSGCDYRVSIAKGTVDNVVDSYDNVGDAGTAACKTVSLNVTAGEEIFIIYKALETPDWFGYTNMITYTAIGEPEPAAQVGDEFKFAELAGPQNPQNGLTLYDLEDGTLTPFANYDPAVNGGRWWNNADEQLTFFDPTCDVANNYALGQASAGRDIVIGWKAVETGTVDVFAWHAIQGSGCDYRVSIAKGTVTNVLDSYDNVGDAGTAACKTVSLNVTAGEEVFIIYKALETPDWFGYTNVITYTAIGEPEPEPAAQVGDEFKFAELAGAQNPQNGLTLYDLAEGVLTPFVNYDPAVNGGRWWNNADEQLTFFDPTCDVTNNYALGQASAGRDLVIGWKAVETGTVEVFAWHAIQGSGCDYRVSIAKGTVANVLDSFDNTGDAGTAACKTVTLHVTAGEEIFIIYKPLETPDWFGYTNVITYTAIGEYEAAAQVGEEFKFASLAGSQNPQNGLTLFYTADGETLVPYVNYDPAVNGGRWWDNTDGQFNFLDPTVNVAENYCLGQASDTKMVGMGWTAPETGVVEILAWHAIQGSGCDYRVSVAAGVPSNVVATFDNVGDAGTAASTTVSVRVAAGDEIFFFYKPLETADWFGFTNKITYTAIN